MLGPIFRQIIFRAVVFNPGKSQKSALKFVRVSKPYGVEIIMDSSKHLYFIS